jgi:transcriptional regulator GlxA family with amidase domain
VTRLLRRIFQALLGAPPQRAELGTSERLDAAHRRLKETIPPPEE